jgi:bromodomain-containing factor 1
VLKLYNLVCRGGRKPAKAKGAGASSARAKKTGGTGKRAMGGANRKTMNEQEEAERIRRMEEQLRGFDQVQPSTAAAYDQRAGEESSSEEESSDEE